MKKLFYLVVFFSIFLIVSHPKNAFADGQITPWGITATKVDIAHKQGLTGKGVKIAVIDSGADLSHEDLKYKEAISFLGDNNSQPPIDYFGHGTHVAGIIAAQDNGKGVIGVAPDAEIYSLR